MPAPKTISKLDQKSSLSSLNYVQATGSNKAIGVFDSGVGGLSIASCIQQALPNESIIYVADTLHAPYGEKSVEQIQTRVNIISDYLIEQGVKAIVVACNTATVNAIEQLRSRVNIPIIGVEPAIKPASAHSAQQKVGILVTQATAHNSRFLNLIATHKQNADVYIQACPGLVELIEQGNLHSPLMRELLSKYLTPLKEKSVDTLVLGCTHYPFVTDIIREIVGDNVTIMETALPVTEQLQRQLSKHQLNNSSTLTKPLLPSYRFISSCYSKELEEVFNKLLNKEISLENVSL